jgi:hypothetical protein
MLNYQWPKIGPFIKKVGPFFRKIRPSFRKMTEAVFY